MHLMQIVWPLLSGTYLFFIRYIRANIKVGFSKLKLVGMLLSMIVTWQHYGNIKISNQNNM